MNGFGCHILAYDPAFDQEFAGKYAIVSTDLDNICAQSDIITLHVPLNEQTKYLINTERIRNMKFST